MPYAGKLLLVSCGRADPQHDIVCRPYTENPEGKGGGARLKDEQHSPRAFLAKKARPIQILCSSRSRPVAEWAPPNFKFFKRRRDSSLHPTWNGNNIPTNILYYESLPASRSMNDASSHPIYERVYSRKVSVSTRRTRVAFWSIFNFIPSRKSDRRWGFQR